ncbi:hypothetical protein K490DRAFT_67695 [Saccharata proteae CBS 121410]|uniref:Uncharacterized protein n=1 Tax=Saccharata proteae CBS 121410 TaxID=1314787 RepID=A0A9P4HPM0_9PEZI|nr:hypothetical protein K490DRAFT_67695 [Saccharata proteae CBS 121410]
MSHNTHHDSGLILPPAQRPVNYLDGTRPTLLKRRRWMPAKWRPYADPVTSTLWRGCSLVQNYWYEPEPWSPIVDPLYGAERPPEVYDELSRAPRPMNAEEVLESVAEDVAKTAELREVVAKLWKLDEDYVDVGDSEEVEGFVGDDGLNKAGGVQQHFHLRDARKMQLRAREEKKRETETAFKPLKGHSHSSGQVPPPPGIAPLRDSKQQRFPRCSTYGTDRIPTPSSIASSVSSDTSGWFGSPADRSSDWDEVERPGELPFVEQAKGAAVRRLVESGVMTEHGWQVAEASTRNAAGAALGVLRGWWSAGSGW